MKMSPNPHDLDPQPGDFVEGKNFSCRVVERRSKYTILGDDNKITPLSLLISCRTPTDKKTEDQDDYPF